MKIQVMSDIHFEFHRDGGRSFLDSLPKPEAEILVLAGDVVSARDPEIARTVFTHFSERYHQVIYVPGNHEFYGSHASVAEADMFDWPTTLALTNVFPLRSNFIPFVGGRRFIGDTMWFPDPGTDRWKNQMNDFRLIKSFEPWVYKRNQQAVSWLEKIVSPGDIVVTHHLPSTRSVPKRYISSPLNRFFVCDMESLIEDRKPALWIHGHTHSHCDYLLGETRVVANPFGYPGEGSSFVDNFIVEI